MSTLMAEACINHLEVTVPRGTLTAIMPDPESFYCGILGFKPARIDAFPAPHVFLASEARVATSFTWPSTRSR